MPAGTRSSCHARNRTPQSQHACAFSSCARPDASEALRRNLFGNGEDRLGPWPGDEKLPVVYSDEYNISFLGLENLHPFDSKKYGRVVRLLEQRGVLQRSQLVQAREATLGMLRSVHATSYLHELDHSSWKVAAVTELPALALLPACLLRRRVLAPMRLMAGGTVQAGALALRHGWAINLGGGMHHAHYDGGGGFCAYDDITLLIRTVRQASEGRAQRFMVLDLDVHQGNGHERSKLHFQDQDIFTVDVYNCDIYPRDHHAAAAVDVAMPLCSGTGDGAYLEAVRVALRAAFDRCRPPPDLLIYNAGTDVLHGDPLGLLEVTDRGVATRDEAVFGAALSHGVPIVMLLSGGYTAASTPCIASSLENCVEQFGLKGSGWRRESQGEDQAVLEQA